MTPIRRLFIATSAIVLSLNLLAGCGTKSSAQDQGTGPVPPTAVESIEAGGTAIVEHPERFPLVKAELYISRPALSVTGVVTNDVSRAVPVMSLASGRALDLRVRLGDEVRQGQLLMRVKSNDISSALATYRHAIADETLSKAQFDRAKRMYDRGAIAQKDLEVAQDAEDKALVDLRTAEDALRVLGVDPIEPPNDISILDVIAPVSGVITEQNVTNAAAVRTLDTQNLFTISDMSHVWVVCDVYENDLGNVRIGDSAEIHLNAYRDRMLTGRVSNILPILDPNIRTAKVRIEVTNPGFLKLGMFATAVFHGQRTETHTAVLSTAIVRLHDRDWVYLPSGKGFKRQEVISGDSLPDNKLEVLKGLAPGDQVVSNALVLDRTIEQ